MKGDCDGVASRLGSHGDPPRRSRCKREPADATVAHGCLTCTLLPLIPAGVFAAPPIATVDAPGRTRPVPLMLAPLVVATGAAVGLPVRAAPGATDPLPVAGVVLAAGAGLVFCPATGVALDTAGTTERPSAAVVDTSASVSIATKQRPGIMLFSCSCGPIPALFGWCKVARTIRDRSLMVTFVAQKHHAQRWNHDQQHHGSDQHAADHHGRKRTLHLATDPARHRRRQQPDAGRHRGHQHRPHPLGCGMKHRLGRRHALDPDLIVIGNHQNAIHDRHTEQRDESDRS